MTFEKIKMDGIIWQNLELKRPDVHLRSKSPLVSVNPQTGRIAFNKVVCDLFPLLASTDVCYVQPLKGIDADGQKETFGFRIVAEKMENTGDTYLHVRKLIHSKRQTVCGCELSSKELAKIIGGAPIIDEHGKSHSKKFSAEIVDDTILKVNVPEKAA